MAITPTISLTDVAKSWECTETSLRRWRETKENHGVDKEQPT